MTASDFESTLKSLNTYPVLGKSYNSEDYIPLDLSLNNNDLNSVDVSNSHDLGQCISKKIKDSCGKIAYGGYLEKRGIYNRSSHFNQQNSETVRNIHLGIDLWIDADSVIYSPLDGEIHSFNNNKGFGNYGPTLILEHRIKSFKFYTLYGHLSLASLDDKAIGQAIKKGDQIATLGTAEVNGDYPPHLHFQIILDIQDFTGDYPGVSSKQDLEFYKKNCPNPKVLLTF